MTSAAVQKQDAESTLTFNTSRFGAIEVDLDKIITMTTPFPGFPDSRRFILRPHGPESPFFWLQSLDDPHLAFVVIPAATLLPDYRPKLGAATETELQLEGAAPDLLLILTIPPGQPEKMTANLLGPVALNPRKRLACQALLDPSLYELGWPVFTDK
ncbi:MAG: flagellar assembly protein FliW [Desulfurivibrionaceae bacterium]|nr:flagellar assembly protein FliW [Desulfurivibrionaceae bacterium]